MGERESRMLLHAKKQGNPITPIPPRASVQPANPALFGRPGVAHLNWLASSDGDVEWSPEEIASYADTRELSAQAPSTVWQYESPNYEAASSLPALSLLVSETPTQPQLLPSSKETRRLPRVDEIDTIPPVATLGPTTPVPETTLALVPVTHQAKVGALNAPEETAPTSWTAGRAANSSYAQLVANRAKRKKQLHSFTLNPLDRVRWWLLHPGRIEFILWLGGTILLILVTCVLLLVTALSFQWLTPGLPGEITSSNSVNTSTNPHVLPTVMTAPGLIFTLIDKGPMLPGQSIHLHGQGFTPRGQVIFTYDGTHTLLDQNGQSNATQTDAHGSFNATVSLGEGPAWSAGRHLIVARDVATNRLAALDIVLASGPLGKSISTTPSPDTTPRVTSTPTAVGSGGGLPTPVRQTPVPITPTATVGKTPTPSPSPTRGPTTPTPTPTVGKTLTPTVTPGNTPTHTVSSSSSLGGSSLSNDLTNNNNSPFSSRLGSLNPLVWLMVACYTLALILLGIAGVLHKRRV